MVREALAAQTGTHGVGSDRKQDRPRRVGRTEDEEDLGIILFAAHDGEWSPAGENEYIFYWCPL